MVVTENGGVPEALLAIDPRKSDVARRAAEAVRVA
jgi:hypothetical protein